MCPPPDGDDGGYAMARYGDEVPYLTNRDGDPYDYATMGQTVTRDDGSTYLEHCFHNRSLQSPVHFASITDYWPRNEGQYAGIDAKDTNVSYINTAGEEWNQEKHPQSFYQLCVAERAKKTLCCEGTSRAPCQPASQRPCKYPGYNSAAPNGAGFCESASRRHQRLRLRTCALTTSTTPTRGCRRSTLPTTTTSTFFSRK